MRNWISTHKPAAAGIAVVAIAAVAWLAFGYFGVHTLFVDDSVSEAAPVFDEAPPATPAPTAAPVAETTIAPTESTAPAASEVATTQAPVTTEAPATTTGIVEEYAGTFVSEEHPAEGRAVVLGNGTGQRFLRFENFATDNGPDLNVYLYTADRSDFIDLGDLKGNIGDQNYEIPADVDLSVYSEVSIWCVRFSVSFGSADLVAA